jgi:acyl-CoA hydrolase
MKEMSVSEAIGLIGDRQRLFVQGSAATPQALLIEIVRQQDRFSQLEILCISILGDAARQMASFEDKFIFNAMFVSAPIRKTVNEGPSDYIPVFLSEIHRLFEPGLLPPDVAIIQVSPPDKHGFCSLGVSVDIARAAVRQAKIVIAQVNPRMPRTHGDGLLHVSEITAAVQVDEPLQQIEQGGGAGVSEQKIGAFIAGLIEDRSTLQTGIGSIPDAVLAALGSHKDLGIHTEMFSDGVIPLVEKGIINGKYKKKFRGRLSTAFVLGSRKLYDYVDDNPQCAFLEASYVNDTRTIRENPRVVAINSALEIDLTGQVCADSIGMIQYSGVGGQMDFIRGAALSDGGKPIIALTSVTGKGISKIVPFLKQGAGVVTTRAHVHYVVTEYGYVNLFGKNLRERAELLCGIAHPDHREMLDREIRSRFGPKMFAR